MKGGNINIVIGNVGVFAYLKAQIMRKNMIIEYEYPYIIL
jgi:hypothetical protein